MIQLFDTHFSQAMLSIVMVILGTAGGLFTAGTSVFVVAVIALSMSVVFFSCQPVQSVVAAAAVQYDIRQNTRSRSFGLFAGQTAGVVVLKTGVHSALAAQGFPVQVAGTKIQFVDGAPVRQGGGDAVAQFVILMLQNTICKRRDLTLGAA